MSPRTDDTLGNAREKIDRIDRDFVRLLAERMEAVRRVVDAKKQESGAPLRDPERERLLFEAWAKEAETLGISGYFAGRVLREILNYSRRHQERLLEAADSDGEAAPRVRVGYQGIAGAYSELSIAKLFTTRHEDAAARIGFRTFAAAVDAVEAGEIDYALLPVENTIAGSINEVYRLLTDRDVVVVDEEVWSVEHCLAGLPGATPDNLRVVRSHPVALQQCQRFLDGLVGVRSESCYDTAAAAQAVAETQDRGIAAICSEDAALSHGLEVLRREIADDGANLTRFLLVALKPAAEDLRVPGKTSLTLTLNHRRGALAACLQAFARHEVNLTKLESRPMPGAPWEYLFYVDIEGWASEEGVSRALEEVRQYTNHLRVLGTYPRRADVGEEVVPAAATDAVTPPPEAPEPACPAPSSKLRHTLRRPQEERSVVRVGHVEIGGPRFCLISGPCAVESKTQIHDAAALVKRHGASILRGGAFKPRTSPYSFQGLGFAGLDLLAEAGEVYEMPVVTEVLRAEDVDRMVPKADMLQVGARNMQNFELLKKLGTVNRPILLKRGMSATIEELMLAAEYIMAGGNRRVILCERGIRTFETATRNTLDVSAVPVLKARTHLPVIVDPSHAAGVRELVVPLGLAAAAAGADGLIVEAHPKPEDALCDKEQAQTGEDLARLMAGLKGILESQGRTL